VMNALKHAGATDIWISVREEENNIVLRLRDNGQGFDSAEPGPEGHFGLAMMRERAKVGGGSFAIHSTPGEGTLVTAYFPTALLQSERHPGTSPTAANNQGHASPDTRETTAQEDVGSRETAHA
jgi:signal transduction histidine kinase